MKKTLLLLAVAMLIVASSAFAEDILTAYTVGGYGLTGLQDEFTTNETPWLYVVLPGYSTTSPNLKVNSLNLANIWKFGATTEATLSDTVWSSPGATQNVASAAYWVSPSDWLTNPLLHNQVGNWTISGINSQYFIGSNPRGPGSSFTSNGGVVNFRVVPEPVSAALFLIGGIALSTRKFFTKNNNQSPN